MSKRYEELDSLRGAAAVSVVLSHLTLTIPGVYFIEKLKNTPLHIFWAGHEAVILFFILSGFVLSLPYFSNKAPYYRDYLIKRVCRIYIPFLASIVLAIVAMYMLYGSSIAGLSKWFNIFTQITPLTADLIINHILMLGEFNTSAFNGVIWSLVHEMRISILFPVLIYLIQKYNWRHNIMIALSGSLLYYLLYYGSLKILQYDTASNPSSYFATLHYIAFFIIGALMAKHIGFFKVMYTNFTYWLKICLVVMAVLAYTYAFWFPRNIPILHLVIIDDWATAVGACIFIIFCINSTKLKSVMLLKPVHFIGKISYSLYLFHLIVIFSMFHVLYGKLPMGIILLSSLIILFVMASATYYLLEIPSIKLGRMLTSKKTEAAPKSNPTVPGTVSLVRRR